MGLTTHKPPPPGPHEDSVTQDVRLTGHIRLGEVPPGCQHFGKFQGPQVPSYTRWQWEVGRRGGQSPNCPSTSLILINQGLAARTRKPPPHKKHLWKWSKG